MGGLSLSDPGYITVPRPNGTTAYLPGQDFAEPSPVFEGGNPALIWIDETTTRFLRPPIAGDPDDVNAEDNIATVSGGALAIGIHDGNVVEVEVTPSTTSPVTGAPVEFQAAALGGLPEERFTFVWTFGDGQSASGESVTHAFAGSGTYAVRVTATGEEGSGGESGSVGIVVGDPPPAAQPGASPTPPAALPVPAGDPGKGGAGRGGKGGKPGSGGNRKTDGGGVANRHRDAPALRPDPRDPPTSSAPSHPPPPEAASPPPAARPTAASEGTAPGAEGGGEPAGSEAPTRPAPSPHRAADGELVRGRLVGDELRPTALEESATSPSGQGSRSAPGAIGGGVGLPVIAFIVVALFGGGVLFEWRRGRPAH